MMGDRIVDINVATVEELETLVGVGRAKAEAIVATRTVSVMQIWSGGKIDCTGCLKRLLTNGTNA